MSSVFGAAARTLEAAALHHDTVLSMYSGGKESLCVLDLCCQVFRRVIAVHLYLVPGMAWVEERLEYARKRFGVEVYEAPAPLLSKCLRHGIYCFPDPAVKPFTFGDCVACARAELGVEAVAWGAKRGDSLVTRRRLKSATATAMLAPLASWSKWDILAFLAERKIPVPESPDGNLSTYTLAWIHDNHPADWQKLCEVFPHAESAQKRREWFGGGSGKRKAR